VRITNVLISKKIKKKTLEILRGRLGQIIYTFSFPLPKK